LGCGCLAAALAALFTIGLFRMWSYAASQGNRQPLARVARSGKAHFREVAQAKLWGPIPSLAVGDVNQDGAAEVVALDDTEVTVLDQTGKTVSSFDAGFPSVPQGGIGVGPSLDMGRASVRLATLQGGPAIVARSIMGPHIHAYRHGGQAVFTWPVSGAVSRAVEIADLDGAGDDEVLIAQHGRPHLECTNSGGKQLWGTDGPDQMPPGALAVLPPAKPGARPRLAAVYPRGVQLFGGAGTVVGQWPRLRLVGALRCTDLDGDGRPECLGAQQVAPVRGVRGQAAMQQMRRMNLFGLDDQGRMVWQSAVGIGDAELMRERMDWGDLDGDGTGEWVAAIADGTIRVYAKDGKELGRQARGDYVTALCVQGPTRSGQPARLWLAVGRRVLGLEWQTW
jgi:hypothetical protein